MKLTQTLVAEMQPATTSGASLMQLQSEKTILLSNSDGWYNVKLSRILYCSSERNYTTFFLEGKKQILVSQTLKQFDDMLFALGFYRAHKSCLVNITKIESILKKEGICQAVLCDGSSIVVSCRERQHLLNLIQHTAVNRFMMVD